MEKEIKNNNEKRKSKYNKTGFTVLIVCLILLSVVLLFIQNQLLTSMYVDKNFSDSKDNQVSIVLFK